MKKNMGGTDRMIRIIIAIVAAILYYTKTVPETLGLILLIVAIVFLITSFLNFCPLYSIFGINTKKKDN